MKERRNKNDSSGKILTWGTIGVSRKRMWLVMEARESVLTPVSFGDQQTTDKKGE